MKKLVIFAVVMAALSSSAYAKDVYLDKVDKPLDTWWNALDNVCRGGAGAALADSDASDVACYQRLEVDKLIKKMGCWNIYPATGKADTSYWKCKG